MAGVILRFVNHNPSYPSTSKSTLTGPRASELQGNGPRVQIARLKPESKGLSKVLVQLCGVQQQDRLLFTSLSSLLYRYDLPPLLSGSLLGLPEAPIWILQQNWVHHGGPRS